MKQKQEEKSHGIKYTQPICVEEEKEDELEMNYPKNKDELTTQNYKKQNHNEQIVISKKHKQKLLILTPKEELSNLIKYIGLIVSQSNTLQSFIYGTGIMISNKKGVTAFHTLLNPFNQKKLQKFHMPVIILDNKQYQIDMESIQVYCQKNHDESDLTYDKNQILKTYVRFQIFTSTQQNNFFQIEEQLKSPISKFQVKVFGYHQSSTNPNTYQLCGLEGPAQIIENQIKYRLDCKKGMSGGAVLLQQKQSLKLIGIHQGMVEKSHCIAILITGNNLKEIVSIKDEKFLQAYLG